MSVPASGRLRFIGSPPSGAVRPSVEDLFGFIRDDFNRRVKTERAFRARFAALTRRISVKIDATGEAWNFALESGTVGDIARGPAPEAEVYMTARDVDTVYDVFSGKVRPSIAMKQGRVRVEASLPDLLLLKRLLDDESERIARFLDDYARHVGAARGTETAAVPAPAAPVVKRGRIPIFGPDG